jgi:hypothetical protein
MADSIMLPALCPEATTGFEPVIAVLQTAAFPLGYVAVTNPLIYDKAGDGIRTHDPLLGKEMLYH